MKLGIVGCGFVADYYMLTLGNHPELVFAGACDRDGQAAARFGRHFGARIYEDLGRMLADPEVELVLNLTNPSSHYAVSRAALLAGKHVYSEKPLALDLGEARELVALAARQGRLLAGAPASHLQEAPQALFRAVREGRIGEVRLAYAEMEDAMVFRENHRDWRSPSGAPWPAVDEFATGATLEHAGYYLTWLCALFGPAVEMTAFAARCFPDKGTGQPRETVANDFSVACLRFADGTVARLSCGLAAPKDRSFHLVGTEGVLSVTDGWDAASPVYLRGALGEWRSRPRILGRVLGRIERGRPLRHWFGERLRFARPAAAVPGTSSRMDFARGPAMLAEAARTGRPMPYGADFAAHVTELALVAQNADRHPMPYRPETSFTAFA